MAVLIAPPGDNIELSKENIGRLEKDFILDKTTGDKLDAGSIIFKGEYRGHPGYNQLLLMDEEGNVLNGTAVFMSEVPSDGLVYETSEGYWLFSMTASDYALIKGRVKAVLYRVDDAMSSTGQRVVSDTFYYDLPSTLPNITLTDELEA